MAKMIVNKVEGWDVQRAKENGIHDFIAVKRIPLYSAVDGMEILRFANEFLRNRDVVLPITVSLSNDVTGIIVPSDTPDRETVTISIRSFGSVTVTELAKAIEDRFFNESVLDDLKRS